MSTLLVLHRVTGILSMQRPGMPQRIALDQMRMLAEDVFPKVRAG